MWSIERVHANNEKIKSIIKLFLIFYSSTMVPSKGQSEKLLDFTSGAPSEFIFSEIVNSRGELFFGKFE
jgi:hypothetical protein